ncbi:unnamed protein product [Linum trigynum]|uniref:Uncharacterized protein n=1 Tax=Linum trigynum TaxID=586398 RepID=A0AAV2FAC5_9ROSI
MRSSTHREGWFWEIEEEEIQRQGEASFLQQRKKERVGHSNSLILTAAPTVSPSSTPFTLILAFPQAQIQNTTKGNLWR